MMDKLVSKKALTILGMNSGTSADGIDLALIRFGKAGKNPEVSILDGTVIPYPRRIKTELERFIRGGPKSVEDLARMDMAFGHLLGKAAAKYVAGIGRRVDLIASHGQTVGHFPEKQRSLGLSTGASVQIGDGNAIALETKIPVVTDFRRADIAAGGEGAPLTPWVNQMLFGQEKKSRIIINIGGIANYSYHPAGGKGIDVRGRDCGPGNVLSDMVCRLFFDRKYDRGGSIARKGRVLEKVISLIEKSNMRRQVSTGREKFDQDLLARLVFAAGGPKAHRADIVASIVAATARLINRSIRQHLKDKRLEGVYLTGGGRKNIYLVECLQALTVPVGVYPIEALGFDGDLLEAVSFAVLGGCFVAGIPSTLSHITGSKGSGIAGKLTLPPA